MKKFISCAIFFFLSATGFGQMNILDFVHKINADKYWAADIIASDTVVDLKNSYLKIVSNVFDNEEIVFQSVAFYNDDSSVIIALTGLFQDEQCGFHKSVFLEYSAKNDTFVDVSDKILPNLDFNLFLKKAKVKKLLLPYFDEVKSVYLGKEATFDDFVSEIYSTYCIIPPKGIIMTVTLDICDYIPNNQVSIKQKVWNAIETDFENVQMKYDKKKKVFVLIP